MDSDEECNGAEDPGEDKSLDEISDEDSILSKETLTLPGKGEDDTEQNETLGIPPQSRQPLLPL